MNTRPVRAVLLGNAAFSAPAGMIALAVPRELGELLGVDSTLTLQLTGAGLLAFGLALVQHALWDADNGPRTLTVILLDGLWVILSAFVVVIFPDVFSLAGRWLVIGVAAMVAAVAVAQLLALRELYRIPGRVNEYRLCISIATPASADAMWNVASALGEISRFAPGLRSSSLAGRETAGVGAERVCEDVSGARWSELCTRWEEGRSFDLEFDAGARDFPFPFARMRAGWVIDPGPHFGCTVRVWWEATPKRAWSAPLILAVVDLGVRRSFPELIQRMAASTGEQVGADVQRLGKVKTRAAIC